MKNLTIPLLVLLVSGGLWAQNPEQAVNMNTLIILIIQIKMH